MVTSVCIIIGLLIQICILINIVKGMKVICDNQVKSVKVHTQYHKELIDVLETLIMCSLDNDKGEN